MISLRSVNVTCCLCLFAYLFFLPSEWFMVLVRVGENERTLMICSRVHLTLRWIILLYWHRPTIGKAYVVSGYLWQIQLINTECENTLCTCVTCISYRALFLMRCETCWFSIRAVRPISGSIFSHYTEPQHLRFNRSILQFDHCLWWLHTSRMRHSYKLLGNNLQNWIPFNQFKSYITCWALWV